MNGEGSTADELTQSQPLTIHTEQAAQQHRQQLSPSSSNHSEPATAASTTTVTFHDIVTPAADQQLVIPLQNVHSVSTMNTSSTANGVQTEGISSKPITPTESPAEPSTVNPSTIKPQSTSASTVQKEESTLLAIQESSSDPIHLTFHNVTKKLTVPAQMVDPMSSGGMVDRTLLEGVCGEVNPGEVVALMGPSGSGKTTLLNTLSGRAMMGVTGHILFNGVHYNKSMKRLLGYVLQADIFFEKLTVREQLTYTALLRLPDELSRKQKLQCVQQTIENLGLVKCAETPLFLVSGGEKKRVNIGTELLTNPSALFLDEPTSGLDSTSAMSLVNTLRKLANQGKTIITSIHQPSSQVFASFDRLILLADGKTIFYGHPQDAVAYFATLDYVSPPNFNPADFVMDLVNSDSKVKQALQQAYETNRRVAGRQMIEQNAANAKTLQYLMAEPTPPADLHARLDSDDGSSLVQKKWPISWLAQFRVLYSRNLRLSWKDLFTRLNISQALSLAIICGLCWLRMDRAESTITDRSSFVFFAMTFWPFQVLFSALMSFPFERAVLNKERASGSYRLSAYFCAKTAGEAPLKLVLPLVFIIISYWMANINPAFENFLGFICAELVGVLVAESIGLLIGAAMQNMLQAMVVATVSVLGLMLVGGFFIQNLPGWLKWAKYLSFFTYSFNASRQFQFRGSYSYSCNLPADQRIIPQCRTQSTFTGADALDYADVTDLSIGANFGCLIAMMVGFRVLAYLALRFTKHGGGRM